jgi:hypothetical protein
LTLSLAVLVTTLGLPGSVYSFHKASGACQQSGRGFGFCYVCQMGKRCAVVDSEVSKNLAIDTHSSLVQAIYQLMVCRAAETSSSIDTHNPKASEISFPIAAITISVPKRL